MALLVAIVGAVVLAPLSAGAAPKTSSGTIENVTGTLPGGGTFTGDLTDLVFSNVDGVLTLTGVLNGEVNVGGVVTPIVDHAFSVVVDIIQAPGGVCDILYLELGPIDLDLLGLVVHLDQIVLDVDAVPGAGNLLGNLLCAVSGLLDGSGNVNALARLLNQILALLG
jgi:hypothetical protein